MRSNRVQEVTREVLAEVGFEPFWKPVDKVMACLSWGEGEQLLLVKSTAWDGATEGRMETIFRCTAYLNNKRVRTFFAGANPLEPLMGECSTRE